MCKKDLISREAALENIRRQYCCGCHDYHGIRCRSCDTHDILDMIEDAPAIDAVPVVHGRWIEGTLYSRLICSECGHEALYNENANEPYFTKFCPECGARMDEEVDDALD